MDMMFSKMQAWIEETLAGVCLVNLDVSQRLRPGKTCGEVQIDG